MTGRGKLTGAGGRTGRFLPADGLLALALAGLCLVGSGPAGQGQPGRVAVDTLGYALAVAAAAALCTRRVWPLATFAVVTAATSGYLVLGYPYGPILVVFVVAAFTAARRLPTPQAAAAAAGALPVLLVHMFVGVAPTGWAGLLPGTAWVLVPFAAGTVLRVSREAAERDRAEQVRERAYSERLRIAQEVHDVVGHGLAAIHMRAEVALHLLANRPGAASAEQAGRALGDISRTSKQALDELRATLAVVRRPDATDAVGTGAAGERGTAADRSPAAGLARLDELVARMTGTGVPVTVEVTGTPGTLPAVVDLAAYRVVQESLTNVLRHAGPATATVRIAHRPDELAVAVTDTGRGPVDPGGRHPGGGHGLAGMRERVTALGGRFEAGPAPRAGFAVRATFPLRR